MLCLPATSKMISTINRRLQRLRRTRSSRINILFSSVPHSTLYKNMTVSVWRQALYSVCSYYTLNRFNLVLWYIVKAQIWPEIDGPVHARSKYKIAGTHQRRFTHFGTQDLDEIAENRNLNFQCSLQSKECLKKSPPQLLPCSNW